MAFGFLNYPTGSITQLPNSPFQAVPGRSIVRTVASPVLYGGPGTGTFTRRYGRWLPAHLSAVSADSSHYAYAETYGDSRGPRSRIHVVDVATGEDRVVYDQGFYGVLDYENDGIYLFTIGYADAPNRGLWRLNPSSGSLQQIVGQDRQVDFVGSGAAWYSDLAPGDQIPSYVTGLETNFFFDRLMRVDLKAGGASPWFRRPGKEVHAIGVDGFGHPLVTVLTPDAMELWIVSAPNVGRLIYSGPGYNSSSRFEFSAPLPDRYGVWIGGGDGVFLYGTDGSFSRISSTPGQVAGRCT